MRLVLVRHGQTSSNVHATLDTLRPGAPLTRRGRAQARELADRWPDLVGSGPSVVAVSPLARTRETAAPLLQRFGLAPLVRPGIREVRAGDLEMNGDLVSDLRYGRTVRAWADGDLGLRMPGGEDGRDVLRRTLPVVDEVARRAWERHGERAVAVLVAHGSVLRATAAALAGDVAGAVIGGRLLGNAHTAMLRWEGGPREWPRDPWGWVGAWQALTWDEVAVEDLAGAQAGGA
jgi:probable phosphoglycerate mutase